MEYELTQHASDAIAEREILTQWIESTKKIRELLLPDTEEEDIEHRFRRIDEFGNKVLHVVINNKANPIRIVTVYFDRAMKGRL